MESRKAVKAVLVSLLILSGVFTGVVSAQEQPPSSAQSLPAVSGQQLGHVDEPTITCEHGVSRKACRKISQQIIALSQGTPWTWVVKNDCNTWAGLTFPQKHETTLNVRYMDAATIAHELGHILTGSHDEVVADTKGRELCPKCYLDPVAAELAKLRSELSAQRAALQSDRARTDFKAHAAQEKLEPAQ